MSVALLWLRRDLRLADHPALCAALGSAERLVPVFCLDRRLLEGRNRSDVRTQLLIDCLKELDRSLQERGSGLVLVDGAPERKLPALARALGAQAVHASADLAPFAVRRDRRVRRALESMGVALHLHPGLYVVDDPAAIRTRAGEPHTTFTPYHRAWCKAERRAVLAAPPLLPPLVGATRRTQLPSPSQLGLRGARARAPRGGEEAARQAMEAFLAEGLDGYARDRQLLREGASSRLSPYLRFGCISPRELEALASPGADAQELHRQLCWRDFYAQVLRHFPENVRHEHQRRYRGTLRFERSERAFQAWREGRTGYPIVDAAMRQLASEGWLPNRARLISACFLCKDLGIDWRWGERWFMRQLLDGDVASNNGNWQWIASVGVDPQPPARRLYNPVLQQRRYDPDGRYVRRHLPELARVPDEHLAEPWLMPAALQREVGCVIGRDYPAPIVEHACARREALCRYERARHRGAVESGRAPAARQSVADCERGDRSSQIGHTDM
ncbi:MAG TPA: deoxyribodipyrimidine photo-lyase [Solirubrobacteraceae bacterium]|nr:deoxyribodipyrimidine photo-lyase [Solirubrobacteraceae bacterium]